MESWTFAGRQASMKAGQSQMTAAKNAGKIPTLAKRASRLPGATVLLRFHALSPSFPSPAPRTRRSSSEEGCARHRNSRICGQKETG